VTGIDETPVEATDVGVMMAFAQKVIVVPGYGMAVAQAQHEGLGTGQLLIERGVTGEVRDPSGRRSHARSHERAARRGRRAVRHHLPTSTRSTPSSKLADVASSSARTTSSNRSRAPTKASPIYGMPILNVDKASRNVIVVKRGKAPGSPASRTLSSMPTTRACSMPTVSVPRSI
jgi:NAD(P) transhydrogenase subunit beta